MTSWPHPHQHQHQHPPASSWERYSCVAPPNYALLQLADAKAHLRVTSTDDDAYIESLIGVATGFIDGPSGIGIATLTQTWKLTLEALPLYFRIGLGPVKSITSITYVDNSGTTQTVDPSLYRLITGTTPAQVINKCVLTDYLPESIQVTFTCGYSADASLVPADLKQAALLMVSHFYDVREIVSPTRFSTEIPFSAQAILNRYAVPAVA